MANEEKQTAQAEHGFHHYTSNRVPWYVCLAYVLFGIFAVLYLLRFFVPEIQQTFFTSP